MEALSIKYMPFYGLNFGAETDATMLRIVINPVKIRLEEFETEIRNRDLDEAIRLLEVLIGAATSEVTEAGPKPDVCIETMSPYDVVEETYEEALLKTLSAILLGVLVKLILRKMLRHYFIFQQL